MGRSTPKNSVMRVVSMGTIAFHLTAISSAEFRIKSVKARCAIQGIRLGLKF
jgi:hypothetical protein